MKTLSQPSWNGASKSMQQSKSIFATAYISKRTKGNFLSWTRYFLFERMMGEWLKKHKENPAKNSLPHSLQQESYVKVCKILPHD